MGRLPLSIPPPLPLEKLFSVVALVVLKLDICGGRTSIRAKGITRGRTSEASEAKIEDLGLGLTIHKQVVRQVK